VTIEIGPSGEIEQNRNKKQARIERRVKFRKSGYLEISRPASASAGWIEPDPAAFRADADGPA
jgi:hypothetical protein